MASDDGDDEPLVLSSHALAALQEFYADRDAHSERFERLKEEAEDKAKATPLSMEVFTEDWNKSQFWYSDETATTLAKELLASATAETRIAVVSAPSVFVALRNLIATQRGTTSEPDNDDSAKRSIPKITLLEHDARFEVFGADYVFYDFQQPLRLPAELKGAFDRIICDPPFLSEDCQTKAALTVRWLARSAPAADPTRKPRVIVCTGERMGALVTGKLYGRSSFGLRETDFEPCHVGGRLGNEFRCYASFEGEEWRWMAEKEELEKVKGGDEVEKKDKGDSGEGSTRP